MTSPAETSSPAALPTRPEARTFRVEDLVSSVLSGRIRIPAFQRGIKWDPTDALALLDSIDRGYPIGTLLLWRRPAPEARIEHGSVTIEADARPDALWVVDGQQRIVSLTRIFAGQGFPEEPFAAFYDLQKGQFRRLGKRDAAAEHDLPLTEVLDSSRLVEWLVAHPQFNRKIAAELGKRLREFEIPAYVVDTDDERTVREIFRRANNTGKRMEDSDVFHGLYGARGPSPANLREVAAGLADLDFGPLDDAVLHNMLLATRGTDLSKDRVPTLSQEQAHQAMIDLALCARAAIRFFREDAGVPHVSLLPYQPPLFALARFFHFHSDPHPRSRELLARWLWRGAITGVHNGSTVQVRQMLTAIGEDEHGAVQSLLSALPGRPDDDLDLDDYSFGFARSKVQLLALMDLGPRDLRDGELVVPTAIEPADKDAYHTLVRTIFPRGTDSTGGLANRMFHPGVHNGLTRAIVECEDHALLATHAISDAARRALKFDHHDEFLRLRRAELLAHIEAFTDRRAQWDEADSPPIEALRIRGD
jgi:hypothetical protein